MKEENIIAESDFDKLIEIAGAYVLDVLEDEGFFEDKTDVEREELLDVADVATAMTMAVASRFASFDFEKIRQVDKLAQDEKFEEAHKVIFDMDEEEEQQS